ncbi:long-chain fatty acid--CoA ligase [Noviherbaspirillum denitrificans]|uniref:Long-chain fatty acid--CoA ligase n=1 Tax=Noviherbaspirillum denitrificans TaxID=1968433 RepID=A0A254T7Z9_9BURK|nr:long-chain fatty acid--CoA ligase [Noviherbaspirillum denitrificans]OWW18769.1 long-chain fatty acid--CoA ligase [Noviherbaspirillum denitrificans]
MSDRHFAHWPPGHSRTLSAPQTNLYYNVEVSAARWPDKPYIQYYGTPITFAEFRDETERIAGWLEQVCKVKRGDRVLLYMQNSPQFVLAYYGILRANAVVVPVNPMNLTAELRHYVKDTGANVAIVAQDLYQQMAPLVGEGLEHILVAAYSDYIRHPTDLRLPDIVAAPRQPIAAPGVTLWSDALEQRLQPGPLTAGLDDLCVMPYTSGTTGHPKGCMHTHRGVMFSVAASMQWFNTNQDGVILAVLPFFHVTGMVGSMSGPLYHGCTIVLMTRWDREVAAECVQRYKVKTMQLIATMVVDLLANPRIAEYDFSSLHGIRGGGAAMPEAVAQKMKELIGVPYVEGYGMSETIGATHINPMHRPLKQCLGIPLYNVDARVVDPSDFHELPPGEVGEIIVHAPHVMQGYWNNPQASADTFVELDGQRFLRTGDLARTDEDGYFFMVDRLKRMINASGFKVWPAEVEALLYQHPAIQEACVIAAQDVKRGETVKAVVVLREAFRGKVSEQEIVDWAHQNMAAYKSPRIVQFVEALPKSSTGKLQWRELQEREKMMR